MCIYQFFKFSQAYKTMEIYSTSDILIFHLKRFKNSNKYFKSKLEALIHFPIEGFDVSPFVKEASILLLLCIQLVQYTMTFMPLATITEDWEVDTILLSQRIATTTNGTTSMTAMSPQSRTPVNF